MRFQKANNAILHISTVMQNKYCKKIDKTQKYAIRVNRIKVPSLQQSDIAEMIEGITLEEEEEDSQKESSQRDSSQRDSSQNGSDKSDKPPLHSEVSRFPLFYENIHQITNYVE